MNGKKIHYRTAVCMLLAAEYVSSANAAPPAAQVTLHAIAAESDGSYLNGTTSATLGRAAANASWKDGFLNLSSGPFPSVSADASFAGGSQSTTYTSQGVAGLTYYFTVISPNGGPVPIIFTGLSKLSQAGLGAALSDFDVFNDQGIDIAGAHFACTSTYLNNCGFNSFLAQADFLSYRADINGQFSGAVTIRALANAYADYYANSSSAYIDPLISIDPTFLANNPGSSLIISAGIGNGSPGVPEPASWTMMIVGFAGIGFVLRLRAPFRRKPGVS